MGPGARGLTLRPSEALLVARVHDVRRAIGNVPVRGGVVEVARGAGRQCKL
jgi:hypothetical protein